MSNLGKIKKMKCFYFTYAGCWSTDFIKNNEVWDDNNIEMIPIKYTISSRMTWDNFINDVFQQVSDEVNGDEYILWGHSMGATIAYEIYYEIKKKNFFPQPLHIYVSSGAPPHKIERNLINVSDDRFEREFSELGGIKSEVLNSKTLLKLVMRIIKRDIQMLYKYNYRRYVEKMECPLTVLFGDTDKLRKYMYDWNNLPLTECENILCKGDHFFIFNELKKFKNLIIHKSYQ